MKYTQPRLSVPSVLRMLALSTIFSIQTGWTAPIGIVDSGTDLKHPDLVAKAWTNPGNLAGDSYQDDTNGWNFADNNNQIIDYSYLGKFSPDVTRFFEVQTKILFGTATEAEKRWMTSKKDDPAFISELGKFGNFVHGTHVAGISARNADEARILAAKIIPTEIKNLAEVASALTSFAHAALGTQALTNLLQPMDTDNAENPITDGTLKVLLGALAGQQAKLLAPVGAYLKTTGMSAANCSFGTGLAQAKTIVATLAKSILGTDLSDDDQEKYAKVFMNQVLEKGAVFVTSSPQTLFVMAAGNDGANNDQLPTFPTNLKLDNTISVAATRGYDRFATFSNYGVKMVEIAAPGVGILSDIPGGASITLSGTSQAAPFITNLVGRVLDANPKLSLVQVKQVLMQTVDKKTFLVGKVTSEGIANADRAVRAAELSKQNSVEVAVAQARSEVADVKTTPPNSNLNIMSEELEDDGMPIQLPSSFSW